MSKLIGYIITNNFDVVYDTKEGAKKEYDRQLNEIEEPKYQGAFRFLYSVAPLYDKKKLRR